MKTILKRMGEYYHLVEENEDKVKVIASYDNKYSMESYFKESKQRIDECDSSIGALEGFFTWRKYKR